MANNGQKLSRLDRYFMSNQLRILEALYPDEADQYAVRREAIENGYELIYDMDMDYIYDGDDIMSDQESREVWDTMDMFDAIDRASEKLSAEELQARPVPKFRGYDGNHETKFMAFAAFTVKRLHRFEYLPMEKEGYWNSHMPVRGVYRRMLEEWKKVPMERRFELTKQELIAVLDAAIHPENR